MTAPTEDPRSPLEVLADELDSARTSGFRVAPVVRPPVPPRAAGRPAELEAGPYDGQVGRALADIRQACGGGPYPDTSGRGGFRPSAAQLQQRIDVALQLLSGFPGPFARRLESVLRGDGTGVADG